MKIQKKSPTIICEKINQICESISGDNKTNEVLGVTKHYPPAIKEWKNSVYAYNKNTLKLLPSKDDMAMNLIKSYFYLSNVKTSPRSKRMRSLYRKLTTKRLFVSKPELKQTSDKVIVTIFTFNREKTFLLKKLFFFNRRRRFLNLWRNNNSLNFNKTLMLKKKLYSPASRKIINYSVNKTIRQNEEIKAQFASNLVSEKDKQNLYIKLSQKIIGNRYRSKLTRFSKNIYVVATKFKLKSYQLKYNRMFEKKYHHRFSKPTYTRKSLIRFVPEINKRKTRTRKYNFPYSRTKLNNEMNFLSFKLLLNKKKFAYARKLFYYYFLKYALSMFNIKVYTFKDYNVPSVNTMNDLLMSTFLLKKEKQIKAQRKGKRNKKSKIILKIDKKLLPLYNTPSTLTPQGTKVKLYFYSLTKKLTKPFIINLNVLHNKNNLDYVLSNVNFVISQFLNKVLIKSRVLDKERKLYILFQRYSRKYYFKFISKLWKKNFLLSNIYTKFMINRFKFNRFLPNLKLLISKIYNKKTELNIVNLKYSHLNTDIYTNTITLKLRKNLSLPRVILTAIGLAKKPKELLDKTNLDVDYDINKIRSFNIYESLKLNKNNNISRYSLQNILKKVYPRCLEIGAAYKPESTNNKKVVTSKLYNILNIIKYKTLTGIKIESAGRLTRRYSAARASYLLKYKGNLRNIDYSRKTEFLNETAPAVMLRNRAKANIQYSFDYSKKRIGAFGVKGWISGY